jgi:hypothetical protein
MRPILYGLQRRRIPVFRLPLQKPCHPPTTSGHPESHLLCMLAPGGRLKLRSPERGPARCCVPPVGVVQPTEATPLFFLSHVLTQSQHDVISSRSGKIFGKYSLICNDSSGSGKTLLLPIYRMFIMTLYKPCPEFTSMFAASQAENPV